LKQDDFSLAAEWINNSKYTVAFTGAGVSVESGIPPFRGENGLWSKYNPLFLDTTYFTQNPKQSWGLIKEIFFIEINLEASKYTRSILDVYLEGKATEIFSRLLELLDLK
jgi:NAD-dependent SIR2 family protein deacetylase